MASKKRKWGKSKESARWTYWIVTALFLVPLTLTGVTFLMGMQVHVDVIITQLGYPWYVLKILGIARILGCVAILYDRNPTLKEWAYAGLTFNMLGAAASHAFMGDPPGKILVPLILTCLILISYRQWKTVA